MKFFLRSLLFSSLLPLSALAQFNCGNNIAQEKLFSIDPSARARFEQVINTKNAQSASNMVASYTIPVVFHILHKGGQENISDAQVQNAIAILNRDFQKQNSDTASIVAQFKNLAADCAIQFSLATIDPNGNCTNGITRHYDLNTDWVIDPSDYIYTWPPSKYLNVYVVKTLPSGTAGYTYLPGTVSAAMDAVVILHSYVGSIGTGNGFSSRALTHEVGHWFNLQHVWGSTNNPGVACGDDGVSDTPITKGHSFCNLSGGSNCTSGVVENIQNYMEYSYCTNMYTVGQKTRMHNCLNSPVNGRNNLYTNANLLATGVINPSSGCAPHPEFMPNSNITCVGNSVSFTDFSYNGQVTAWKWSSPMASNTSTVQSGSLTFSTSGLAPIQLVSSNSFGSDSIIKQVVTVLAGAGSATAGVVQGFETGTFPDNKWIASVPSYGSPFIQTNSVSATGTNCVWVNNYYDNPNGPVAFYSPAYNLSGMSAVQLSFSYAYAQQAQTNIDQLKVYASNDCGSNWTIIYSKSGAQLSTAGVPITQVFMPGAGDWKNEVADLQVVAGSNQVYLKFEFTPDVNGPGNNMFIDDINISNVSGVREYTSMQDVLVFPNPFAGSFKVRSASLVSSVKVYDVCGREVLSKTAIPANEVDLDAGSLTKGIYFVEARSGNAVKIIKLVKE
jgi:hypothetical protein